jgi:hypothetical protein
VTTAETDVIDVIDLVRTCDWINGRRNYGFHFIENGQKRGILYFWRQFVPMFYLRG